MKTTYDANTKVRNFKPGDSLNVFTNSKSTQPGKILWSLCNRKKIDDLNYVVLTPDRLKKKRICRVNMIKDYIEKNSSNIKPALMLTDNGKGNDQNQNGQSVMTDNSDYGEHIPHLKNSEVIGNLQEKIEHLPSSKQQDILGLISDFRTIFPDVPGKTMAALHDIEVGDVRPMKQHPYRLNPIKLMHLKKIKYMLDNDIIELSSSEWSSPCVLVPKLNGSYRFVTDYHKLNSFPIP